MLSLALVLIFASSSVLGQNEIIPAGIECLPKGDLFHPDPDQCDKYYECTDKGPVSRLCPDGLVFDVVRGGIERCDYPFNVDCGDRLQLQPPSSRSIECPRQNGIFAHEDPSICNKFYLCVGGEHQLYTCDKDLHFNEYTGVCEWQSVAGRAGCRAQSEVLEDGFSCPQNTTIELNGVSIIHPLFAHPNDCQKYYVCLNGKVPRANSCPSPTVFNDVNMKCDDPANVPGCENWFGEEEEPTAEAKESKPSGNSKFNSLDSRRQR